MSRIWPRWLKNISFLFKLKCWRYLIVSIWSKKKKFINSSCISFLPKFILCFFWTQVGLEGSSLGQWWLDMIGKTLGEGSTFQRVGSRQLAGLLIAIWFVVDQPWTYLITSVSIFFSTCYNFSCFCFFVFWSCWSGCTIGLLRSFPPWQSYLAFFKIENSSLHLW